LGLRKSPRLAFFVSHRGSNMRAIVKSCLQGILAAEPAVLISNNAKSEALSWAIRNNLPNIHLDESNTGSNDNLDRAHLETLKKYGADLIILAGYLKKIGNKVISNYPKRILNIHPSLLPKYGGKGMYGRHIHNAVFDAGEKDTGVTIHLVDHEYDKGPIVSQKRIPILSGDLPSDIGDRVLKEEHIFYVETLEKIFSGEINLDNLT